MCVSQKCSLSLGALAWTTPLPYFVELLNLLGQGWTAGFMQPRTCHETDARGIPQAPPPPALLFRVPRTTRRLRLTLAVPFFGCRTSFHPHGEPVTADSCPDYGAPACIEATQTDTRSTMVSIFGNLGCSFRKPIGLPLELHPPLTWNGHREGYQYLGRTQPGRSVDMAKSLLATVLCCCGPD
ncbi:hypothetical protein N658DRAFT_246848 [Parathielavia hyrcaniae]|uniref:Uncharacterized protein n=1 Tax=Parathielavia hyrcaniae TaxID=113614 RepID=A0AAN6T486_9PEZI|nr:hypothetical protein N658DRAFT_246848 [Parathielavia hyrcaniae]